MALTLRETTYAGFTNKGAPLTNAEIDANWTGFYDLIYANQEAIAAIHTQNTDTKLDEGGANEVTAAELANVVYEVDTYGHVQNTDTKLNEGGGNEVSAVELRLFLDDHNTDYVSVMSGGDASDGSGLYFCDTTSETFALDFRTVDFVPGRIYIVKDIGNNAGVNNITITTEADETIDGVASKTIAVNGGYVFLYVNSTTSMITLIQSII